MKQAIHPIWDKTTGMHEAAFFCFRQGGVGDNFFWVGQNYRKAISQRWGQCLFLTKVYFLSHFFTSWQMFNSPPRGSHSCRGRGGACIPGAEELNSQIVILCSIAFEPSLQTLRNPIDVNELLWLKWHSLFISADCITLLRTNCSHVFPNWVIAVWYSTPKYRVMGYNWRSCISSFSAESKVSS